MEPRPRLPIPRRRRHLVILRLRLLLLDMYILCLQQIFAVSGSEQFHALASLQFLVLADRVGG